MNKKTILIISLLVILLNSTIAHAIRIKDLADIKGVRNNQLVGYGLVVGLDGTGDDDKTNLPIKAWQACLIKWESLLTRRM